MNDPFLKPNNDFEALVLAFKLSLAARTSKQFSWIQNELPDFIAKVAPEDISLAQEQARDELEKIGFLKEK